MTLSDECRVFEVGSEDRVAVIDSDDRVAVIETDGQATGLFPSGTLYPSVTLYPSAFSSVPGRTLYVECSK